jgi:hypothetical protein
MGRAARRLVLTRSADRVLDVALQAENEVRDVESVRALAR